ncbi:hypothetical protein QBC47DRAFT_387038 [Echria macrotheca]|uniref:Uncharacterized protein n=1 Tax=Echria macrotheca TaxID=438768 RepID=A0AAJ0B933_9PEZI|nr:hypothetical protein QBC47DRAFT_387038 [Echria macrotheca]
MSALLQSLQYNHAVLGSGNDSLTLDINSYSFDKSDCPLQDAFKFYPNIQGSDVPARLKTFLYGDGSPQGSGFWNGLPGRTQPVLDSIVAAEKGLFNDTLSCVVDLAKLMTQSPATSLSDLKAVNDAVKKTLRACVPLLADSGTLANAVQKIRECDLISLQASVDNQIFTDWAHAFDRLNFYGQWLRPHQDKLNKVYATSGPNIWFNNNGYPPFMEPGQAPRVHVYQLTAPKNLNQCFPTQEALNLWYTDIRALARNIPVFGNFVVSTEYRMDQFIAGKQLLGQDRFYFEMQQYMLATEMKRVDTDNSSALDLTVRLRGSRRIARYILQAVQAWLNGYTNTVEPALAALEAALWKLYGNLFSADVDEIALNWTELSQACQNYSSAANAFKSLQGSQFEGLTNAGDLATFDWTESAIDDKGAWIYGDGVGLDNTFYQQMAAQLDENKDLVA